jgi:hypothetical protein
MLHNWRFLYSSITNRLLEPSPELLTARNTSKFFQDLLPRKELDSVLSQHVFGNRRR